jgi:hypothetical protein
MYLFGGILSSAKPGTVKPGTRQTRHVARRAGPAGAGPALADPAGLGRRYAHNKRLPEICAVGNTNTNVL